MDTKHTPPPWRERVASGIPDRMISGPGGGVCVIPYKYGTPESRAANSLLIRSAPDLERQRDEALEALRGLLSLNGEASKAKARAILSKYPSR